MVSIIESELTFFEMEIEGCFWDTVELHESPFRVGPKGFDTVDMSFAIYKLIVPMVHTIMLFVSQINQSIIAAPGVRMNDTLKFYLPADNGLQRAFGAIGNDLRVNQTISLENTKDWGFTVCATASFPFDALGSKV